MGANKKLALFETVLTLIIMVISATAIRAQTQNENQVAKSTGSTNTTKATVEPAPVFSEYRGLKIGMPLKEVRETLKDYLKAKGDKQDFLVVSDYETAQVFYDSDGKVTAISIDYAAKNEHVPTVIEVMGAEVGPKADGSLYALKRYPSVGYWVSYNRTSGDTPTVTVTLQSFQ